MRISRLLALLLTLSVAATPQVAVGQTIDELFQQGSAAIDARNYTQAETIYRQAVQLYPKNAGAYYGVGLALYYQGKLDEAIAAYRSAISLDPKSADAYNNLGAALYDQGKLDEAIAAYRTAISLDPKSADAYNGLGAALYDQGKLDEAIAAYRTAISLDPKSADAYYNLGLALYNQGKLDEAIAAYRSAISLDPKSANAYINLGLALRKQGKLDEAIAAYRSAISLDPKSANAYINLGTALSDQGKLDEAIAAYRSAISLDPKLAAAYNNLGLALYDQGKIEEAISTYRQSLSLPEDKTSTPASAHTLAHTALGYALHKQGKLEEAIEEFKQAIKLDPNYATAQNNLKEAQRLLALRQNPQPSVVDDTQWLPSREQEPLVDVLRSVVLIIPTTSIGIPKYGSGWVVKREGNKAWIVTNRHVVTDKDTKKPIADIQVDFFSQPPSGQTLRREAAKIVQITAGDDPLDLAVLEVSNIPKDIKALPIFSGKVGRTTPIRAIGHPLNGSVWSQSPGEISSIVREENKPQLLQLSAILAQGNSGGPAINLQNQVVGVMVEVTGDRDPDRQAANSQRSDVAATGGFGFAYPIDIVEQKLRDWGIL